MIQVFKIWHNLCSELTSMWTFKMYSRNTKTTNEPTASNNKSDRPQVKIWDTWKTLKYLNINDSFHLKHLEISKYKRESKGRWPIKICRFIFVTDNCCLIWLSKAIYFFNNTIIVQVRYIIIETKEFVRIGYNGFLFPHEYSGEGDTAFTWVLVRKKKPVISNTVCFFCFNSTVSYTCTIIPPAKLLYMRSLISHTDR